MKPPLRLLVDRMSVRVVASGDGTAALPALSWSDPDELSSAIAATAKAHLVAGQRVRVELAPELVQQRTLTGLPPVRTRALREIVTRGTSRFFRQNGHPLVSGAVWDKLGGTGGRSASAAAIEMILAEAIVAGGRQAGCQVEDIVPVASPSGVSLLPEQERRRRRAGEWSGLYRVGAVAGLLWVVVASLAWIRLRRESRQVESELADLRAPRAALMQARHAMDNAAAMLGALKDDERRRNEMALSLMRVTRALDGSAFLQSMVLELNGVSQLSGRARQPQQVVSALEAALRESVRPEIGGTRDSLLGTDWQSFSLRFGSEDTP